MRVRNHALDGLRGLAALGVLTLHVWMFTVQGAHGRDELVSLLTGELRLGVVLFFVLSGYLLAGPWVASALDDRPTPRLGRFAVKRAARIVPAYWVAMIGSFWLLAGSGHDYEVSAGQLPLFAAFGQNYVASAAGRLDPPMWSLVVEVSFYAVLPLAGWLLVRCARGGGGWWRPAPGWRARAGVERGGRAAGLARDGDVDPADLPARLRLRHGGRGAGPSPRAVAASWWALVVAGAVLVCADAWWHHQGTGMTGHVVRDLPAALGFAAAGGGGGRPSAGGPLARAPARPGHDLLRPVPVAPAGAAVAALRGPDARRLRPAVARGHGAQPRWSRTRAGCSSSGPRSRPSAAGARGRGACRLPGRAAHQAGAERGVSGATTVSGRGRGRRRRSATTQDAASRAADLHAFVPALRRG